MQFILAFGAWLVMAAILGLGIFMAVKGTFWLLILGLVGFIFAVGKIGCLK